MNRLITSFFKISLFFVLVSTTVYAVEGDTDQSIAKKNNAKVRLHNVQQYRKTIENLLTAEIYFHQQHFARADAHYDKLTDFYHDKDIINHVIQVALKRENFEKALKLASLWHKNEPDSKLAISTLIGLYQYFGRYDEVAELLKDSSIEQVNKTIDIDTIVSLLDKHPADKTYYSFLNYIEKYARNDDSAQLFLALFAIRAELYQEAINASQDLLTSEDEEVKTKALIVLLDAYRALGKPQIALQQLKILISQTTEMVSKQAYAEQMIQFGHVETLIGLLKQEYKEQPKQRIHVTIVELLYNKSRDLEATLEYLHKQQKIETNKADLAALYVLEADFLRELKKFELGLTVIKKADQLFPENLSIYYSQALLLEDIGEIKKSEEEFKKILAIDSANFSALNALGYLLSVHTSRFDEAYGYIKKANDLQPDSPIAIDSLGWVFIKKVI